MQAGAVSDYYGEVGDMPEDMSAHDQAAQEALAEWQESVTHRPDDDGEPLGDVDDDDSVDAEDEEGEGRRFKRTGRREKD
jgi:hypothetical protein